MDPEKKVGQAKLIQHGDALNSLVDEGSHPLLYGSDLFHISPSLEYGATSLAFSVMRSLRTPMALEAPACRRYISSTPLTCLHASSPNHRGKEQTTKPSRGRAQKKPTPWIQEVVSGHRPKIDARLDDREKHHSVMMACTLSVSHLEMTDIQPYRRIKSMTQEQDYGCLLKASLQSTMHSSERPSWPVSKTC